MKTNIDYLNRCIQTLKGAFKALQREEPEGIAYDIYRAACVKEFEIILEQNGKLLKKRLHEYFSSNKAVDRLIFKDIFRYAAQKAHKKRVSSLTMKASPFWGIKGGVTHIERGLFCRF